MGPPERGAGEPRRGVGAASVFHKTRLSDIPRQRLHKAINCLASAQPTNAAPQSLTRLHKLRRLAELRKSPGLPSPSADRHDADELVRILISTSDHSQGIEEHYNNQPIPLRPKPA